MFNTYTLLINVYIDGMRQNRKRETTQGQAQSCQRPDYSAATARESPCTSLYVGGTECTTYIVYICAVKLSYSGKLSREKTLMNFEARKSFPLYGMMFTRKKAILSCFSDLKGLASCLHKYPLSPPHVIKCVDLQLKQVCM